jgi:hypothetical protein
VLSLEASGGTGLWLSAEDHGQGAFVPGANVRHFLNLPKPTATPSWPLLAEVIRHRSDHSHLK